MRIHNFKKSVWQSKRGGENVIKCRSQQQLEGHTALQPIFCCFHPEEQAETELKVAMERGFPIKSKSKHHLTTVFFPISVLGLSELETVIGVKELRSSDSRSFRNARLSLLTRVPATSFCSFPSHLPCRGWFNQLAIKTIPKKTPSGQCPKRQLIFLKAYSKGITGAKAWADHAGALLITSVVAPGVKNSRTYLQGTAPRQLPRTRGHRGCTEIKQP